MNDLDISKFNLTDDDLKLSAWRYLNFTKFVDLIDSQELYFCRADKFIDKLEGKMSFEKTNLPSEIYDNYLSTISRTHSFVNCWHLANYESDAMWQIYGKSETVAIKLNMDNFLKIIDIIKNNLKHNNTFNYYKVKYVNQLDSSFFNRYDPILNNEVTASGEALGYKHIAFEHEKEVRLIIRGSSPEKNNIESFVFVKMITQKFNELNTDRIKDFLSSELALDVFRKIKIDLKLIDEICISPYASTSFENLVKRILEKYKLKHISVSKSTLQF